MISTKAETNQSSTPILTYLLVCLFICLLTYLLTSYLVDFVSSLLLMNTKKFLM